MKILVTGGNGFVGQALVHALVRGLHEVYALDLKDEGYFKNDSIHGFYGQDIGEPFRLGKHFDFVFHLAAYNVTHVGDAAAKTYRRVNVGGTKHVLEAMAADHFVFLSTTKVYQRAPGVIDEDSLVAPMHPYEQSKLQAEDFCRQSFTGKSLTILRSVNIIGPGQTEKAVIPVFITRALRHESLNVFAPRGQWLQFIFVDDIVRLMVTILERSGGLGGLFNVAMDDIIRLEELVARVKSICGSKSPVLFGDEARAEETRVSFAKLAKALPWQPRVRLDAALLKCRDYYSVQKRT